MSEYEPTPNWTCDHRWVAVGPPVPYPWASHQTGDTAPNNGMRQKRMCVRCGGIEFHNVVYLEDAFQ